VLAPVRVANQVALSLQFTTSSSQGNPLPITDILALADDLGKGTIEKVMAKSDAELGRAFLLNPNKFRR